MARSTTKLSTLCHKLLPVAILLALLIASVSQQTIAQNAEASASANANSSGGSGSGNGGSSSAGGILGATTGAITGGIAGAQAGARAGLEAGSSGSAQLSGSIGGVSGSLSLGGGGASASGSASSSSSGSDSSSSSDASASGSGSGSSQGSGSGSASSSASSSGAASSSSAGSTSGSGSGTASASLSITSTTPKPEGLFSKMKEIVKSGVDSLTHDDKKDNSMAQSGFAAQTSGSLGSGSENGASAHVSPNVNSNSASSTGSGGGGGLINKFKEGAKEMKDEVKSALTGGDQASKANMSGGVKIGTAHSNVQIGGSVQMGAGGDKKEGTLSKLVHKVENKASEIGDKIKKPFQEGQQNVHASVNVQADAQPQAHGTEESVAVQVLDKSHQAVKEPLEKALRPIDKVLGVKQDPLLKMYDAGHEKLRQPLAMVSKPVESVFSGAFKTSDEAKREAERSGSEMDRREVRIRDEKLQKQGRSILGEITDRSVELVEKPFEIILRPVDRLLGIDKDGKKNPLIQLIDEIYGISKKPIDAVAKPFENILKKMADGDYQMSIRFNGDSNDPKLFTRLADGALNIADRIVTRPIEFAMRPLGYGQDRKNPIVDATHSLKNATKLGMELFTRPIDRIIKEIADIGAIKDEQQREAEMQRKRQEASRIVHALDKLHEISQTPWEIVLRPVGKVLGYNKEGKKEPLLRAWDVVHQVIRTPIQVLSKPWEDAILGETQRSRQAAQQAPKVQVKATVNVGQASHEKKNFFTEQIRKVEKLATKPFDVITSPIRRLILGEDSKSGAKVNAKAQVGGVQAKVSAGVGSNQGPDKIVKTIEQMNNVVLKPLEVITQPISDMLSSEGKQQSKGVNIQAAASASSSGSGGQQARASGSISAGGISASGAAAAKSG